MNVLAVDHFPSGGLVYFPSGTPSVHRQWHLLRSQAVFPIVEHGLRQRRIRTAEGATNAGQIGKRATKGNGRQSRDRPAAIGDHDLTALFHIIKQFSEILPTSPTPAVRIVRWCPMEHCVIQGPTLENHFENGYGPGHFVGGSHEQTIAGAKELGALGSDPDRGNVEDRR
jgi:hypothetical protein